MNRRLIAILAAAAVPLAALVAGTGTASAAPASSDPGLPLEDITTNPNAQIPGPVLNGAAAGGLLGATGSAALVGILIPIPGLGSASGALLGGLIGTTGGAIVGAVNPDVVPQVLP